MPAEHFAGDRRSENLTEDRVELMISNAVQAALKSHEQHLMLHMDKQFAALKASFSEAFPGGDPHGHRIAHEKAIRNATWWDQTKADAFSKVASAGVGAVVVFLCIAAWEHFKNEMKR